MTISNRTINKNRLLRDLIYLPVMLITLFGLAVPQFTVNAASSLTISPISWNVIGLDSNTPALGPYRFPIGVRMHNTSGSSLTATVTFHWDGGGTGVFWGDAGANDYVNLRTGSKNVITVTVPAGGYAEAFFEVEVLQNASAFDKTRLYHITASPSDSSGDVSTPQPRELYVEHLISQNRNGVRNIYLDGTLIPAGGTMNLLVGHTYNITLDGFTATNGYNQFEDFINLPNTVFQVNSVLTTYAVNSSPYVTNPNNPSLYADACGWDNNPGSPTYRSCIGGDYKSGGDPDSTIYNVTILPSAITSGELNTLLYDFSGSSYHYNADFGIKYYFVIVDPTLATITKSFNPKSYNPPSIDHSLLTITLNNPTGVAITGVHFTDVFPTSPGNMQIYNTTTTNTCGGNLYNSNAGTNPIAVNDPGFKLVGGTIPANSTCTITVNVKVSANGDYTNNSGHLFVDVNGVDTDTGKSDSDTLKVAATPACTNGNIAIWSVPTTSTLPPDTNTPNAGYPSTVGYTGLTAAASYTGDGGQALDATHFHTAADSWSTYGWQTINHSYILLKVDTSQYSSPTMNFWVYQDGGNGPNVVYLDYSTDGGTTYITTGGNPNPYVYNIAAARIWYNVTGFNIVQNSNLWVRIRASGAGNDNSGSAMALDDITFAGCHIPAPEPTFTKSFSPDPIAKDSTSTLTFTVTNNAPGNRALSNLSFTDDLPIGLTVSSGTQSVCGGTNNLTRTAPNTVALVGGSVAAGGTCTFNVAVTGAVAGHYDNVTGFLSSTETGTTTKYAEDTLDVVAPPVLSKAFNLSSILVGGTSTLTFTITNPNNFIGGALSGIAFTDNNVSGWPAGVNVANGGPTPACGGSYTTVSPNSLTFSGGSLAANASCSFSVTVTGTTAGFKTNTTSAVTATGPTALTGGTATANLDVNSPVPLMGLTKQVSTDGTNWFSYVGLIPTHNIWYKFTIINEGEVTLTGISVTDNSYSLASCVPALPSSLAVGASASCVLGPISISSVPSPNPFINTATATSNEAPSAASSAKYGTESIAIVKYVTESYFTAAGNILHYRYAVTNNGGYPLLGPITVSDDKTGTITCQDPTVVGDLDSFFDPGETVLCPGPTASDYVSYTVLPGDVTAKQVINTAHGVATLLAGGTVNSPDASKTVPLAPDLTITKTNDTGGTVVLGNTFHWTLTVTNSASAGPATFLSGNTLLTDNLPSVGGNYSGAPATATNAGGTTGTINCSITLNDLSCTAGTDVTIPSGGSFSITFTVTPTATGSLVNPRAAGVCKVNPGPSPIVEILTTNNDCSDTVTVNAATPTLTTTASGPVTVGADITDVAHLGGGYGTLGGTITFDVFAPGDTTCTGTATGVAGGPVSGAGDYMSANYTTTAVGDYRWIAHYSGDANNNSVSTACNDAGETSSVGKAPTVLTTTALSPVIVGATITDTAHLSGGFAPTGTISYQVFAPGDTTCATPINVGAAKTVLGAGDYTSDPYTTTTVGDYRWIVEYSGDDNNTGMITACNDANETSTANKATPTLTTSATGAVTVGANIADTAHLGGGYGTLGGTITFDVFASGDTTCTGTATGVAGGPVSGAGDYTSADYTTTAVGTYRWIAHYFGDANNNAVDTACNDANESSTVNKASPSISTIPGAGGTIGVTLTDTATLTGGYNPTGDVTFRLFPPTDGTCAGTAAYTYTDDTSPYAAPGFASDATGTWHWTAVYNGDANNFTASSACLSEPVEVDKATPTLTTNASGPVTVGANIADTAHLGGGYGTLGGTIAFDVFAPGDTTCTGTATGVAGGPVSGAGDYMSANYTTTAVGDYRWIAHYSGDANNNAVDTACNDANESSTVNKASPTISTVLSDTSIAVGGSVSDSATLTGATATAGGSVTFTAYTDNACTLVALDAGTVTVTNGVIPDSNSLTFNTAGDYYWQAVYSGDSNNDGATSVCTSEHLVVGTANPTIDTLLSSSSIAVGESVSDSATLTGATADAGGTVIYTAYSDNLCTAGAQDAGTKTVTAGVVPNSNSLTFNTAGDYYWQAVYSGDANNNGATSTCLSEHLVVGKASPTIDTTPGAGGTIGVTLTDTATLTGGFSPTGSVTFNLFPPTDATCSGAAAYSFVDGSTPYAAPGFVSNAVGTWHWTADYSGDTNNNAVSSACADESAVVSEATPTLTTSASGPVDIGATITDTAHLSGGYAPTGTITFEVFEPGDTTCSSATSVGAGVTVSGAGDYTSDTFTTTGAGDYRWRAYYSGDANNSAVSTACNDAGETSTVNKDSPTFTTSAIPDTGTVGTLAYFGDMASFSGGTNLSGTVTFTLYSDSSCTIAVPAMSGSDTIHTGGIPYSNWADNWTPPAPGTYYWKASYSGDANNNGSTSNCLDANEQIVVGKASPSIATTPGAGGPVGVTLTDTATLTGGFSPTGSVTFNLFPPTDATCSGAAAYSFIDGSAPYAAPGFVSNAVGTWHWTADYSGDTNNNAVSSPCADETVLVGKASPTIDTLLSSSSISVGGSVSDSATLTGATSDAGGNVTYTVYSNNLCTLGAQDATPLVNTVVGGVVPNSNSLTFNNAGDYYWQAVYSGDSNNDGATSVCTSEHLVVGKASPTIGTLLSSSSIAVGGSATDGSSLTGASSDAGGTVTYTVYTDTACSLGAQDAGTKTVTAGVVPDSDGLTFNTAGDYYWQAVYSGDSNNNGATSVCTSEHLVVGKARTSIDTLLSDASIAVGGSVSDGATLAGATADAGGTVTYTVYTDNACTLGAQDATPLANTVVASLVPDSNSLTFNTAGDYYWQAVYSGDSNNDGATSVCTSEHLVVGKSSPTIDTLLSESSISVGGTASDSATLTGATADAGGSVTFTVYTDTACSLGAQDAGTKTVTAGVVPDSDTLTFNTAGDYYWQAVYSGDSNNNGATSVCTSEHLVVGKLIPTVTTSIYDETNEKSDVTLVDTGVTVHDTATVSSTAVGVPAPTGTVNFSFYNTIDCTGAMDVDLNHDLVGGVAQSISHGPLTAGSYSFRAHYNGDANYAAADSACEPLTVNQAGLFDPPFGIKTVNAAGLPVLTWTMVWINNANHVPIVAAVHDPIPSGSTYVPGSIVCTPSGTSATVPVPPELSGCYFEAPSGPYPGGRIVWTGTIGDDFGATTAAAAANEVTISFQVTLLSSTRYTVNTATIDSDLNGNGETTDPGEQRVFTARASWGDPGIPTTGFAPGHPTILSAVQTGYKGIGDLTLEVPSLGVDIPIVGVPQTDAKIWDVSWLGQDAGWLAGSAFPTWNGNSVLTAHVYDANGKPGPFVNLGKLKWGDRIIVNAWGQQYTYEVREVLLVTPGDVTEMMKHQTSPWLTLVTCRGFDESLNSYLYRVLVRAVLVNVK